MRGAAVLSLCVMACWAGAVSGGPTAGQDIAVQVRKDHSSYEVRFEFTVPATIEQTWNVLADFDHMAQILSNVDSSRIVSRDGNRIVVAQRSHGHVGPFQLSVDSLRSIVLTPPAQMHSHLIMGDLKASDFTTELHEEGAVTRVTGYGSFVVAGWLGPVLGEDKVASQTRQQYQELRDEILRRKSH